MLLGGTALVYSLGESISPQEDILPVEDGLDTPETVDPAESVEDPDSQEPADTEKHDYLIVIDAGHGGHDPGATGASGLDEKHFTLSLANKIVDRLAEDADYITYLTRSDDTFQDLRDRAAYANELEADVFISIHGNTFTDFKVRGTETYYWTEESRLLAELVHEQLVGTAELVDRGVRKEDWIVLANSEVPAILAEIGYLTHAEEEKWLLSDTGQDRIAEAIVNGIKQYISTVK